jgi:hypothetical protein
MKSEKDFLTIVTYATDTKKGSFQNWLLSVKKLKYNYVILGNGDKWTDWSQRTKAYFNYLLLQDKNNIIILCDSYDLFFVKPPEYLYERFLKFKTDVVIGAERWCCSGKYNDKKYKKQYKDFCKFIGPKNNKYIYLNAGFIMGRVGALTKLYYDILYYDFDKDDQANINYLWMKNPSRLTLDYDSELVGNISYTKRFYPNINNLGDWILDNNSIYRKSSGSIPACLHFPGMICPEIYSLYDTIGKSTVSMEFAPRQFDSEKFENLQKITPELQEDFSDTPELQEDFSKHKTRQKILKIFFWICLSIVLVAIIVLLIFIIRKYR